MSTTFTTSALAPTLAPTLADLAERVAIDGIAAHHDAIAAAIESSEIVGAFPVLAALLVDSTAPPIARERALGRMASLASVPRPIVRTGVTTVWHPAAA